MIGLKRFILSAVAAALLTGCTKSEIDFPLKTGDGILFRPSTVHTRAQSVTNDAVNPFKTMGIYAASTGLDDYNSSMHSANYLQNIKVERADATSEWTTSTTYYWPVGKTTFFGYAPYNATGSAITVLPSGAPVIDFTVNSDQIKQIDLLIASAVKNAVKTSNAVTIPMKHALTKIGFSAKLSHDLSETQHINSIRVTKIELFGVFSNGKHALDAEAVWQDIKDIKLETTAFEVNDDAGKLGGLLSTNLSTMYKKITLDDGYLFMLPQPLTEKAKLRVYVAADWTENNNDISFDEPIEFDLAETGLDWNQGEAINYTINMDITDHVQTGSTISAERVPWSETEIDSDITKRQLNLTRIEADVFDAAITRVYFWSNQPRNEVYISPVCYEGTLSSTVGAVKDVEDIFTNLTAKKEPWEATNLHYDATTGEGYFELNRANSNTAPQSYLLYVYAGGLRRAVQVNVKNTDYPLPVGKATSPFVGTFHRFDEYGERIITWNNTGSWIAIIEPLNSHRNSDGSGGYADYADVVFDRYVSPAQEAGILYTHNPGNAEDYLVTDMKDQLVTIDGIQTRALMGNGKVYMRVGWKKIGARVGGPMNRYAKITILDQINDRNTSKVLGVLFIRKGEDPDYLMRKEDPIAGNDYAGSRNDVLRFSPYDVTSPYSNEIKQNYFDYPFIGSGGATFVKYPSQGGSYFKWGSGRGISLYTQTLPYGYFSGSNNAPTPARWSGAVDVCPAGYRIPAYDNRSELLANYDFPNPYSSLEGLEMVQSMYVKPEQDRSYSPYDWRKMMPYPQNQSENWMFGYYADGYFDRGPITLSPSAYVSYAGGEGYDGLLVFNPYSLSSLFFPATGVIATSGLSQPGATFSMNLTTRVDGYSNVTTTMQLFKNGDDTFLNLVGQSHKNDNYQLGIGRSIRCVKGDKQDLTKDDKYVLYFDVNTFYGLTVTAAKPIIGASGSTVTIPALPSAAATKWNTRQDGQGITYMPGANFTFKERFTVLYAIW